MPLPHDFRCGGGCWRLGALFAVAVLFGQEIAGHGAAHIEVGVRDVLYVVERHLGNRVRPAVYLRNGTADGETPAVTASKRGLIVVVVDVLGDVARLGPLEL